MPMYEKVVVEYRCIICNHVYVKLTYAEIGEPYISPDAPNCNECGGKGIPTGHVSKYDHSRTRRNSPEDLPNLYDS